MIKKGGEAMIKTIKDQDYFRYSTLSELGKNMYYENLYSFVKYLNFEYPNFKYWYKALFKDDKSLVLGREIIICEKDFHIVGIAILKSDDFEKKICTLRVAKDYQRQGIGKKLMELSFEWLQDEKPIITMHRIKQSQFQPLLDYYGFKLEQKQRNYYHIFSTELVYNGILPEKKFLEGKIEILDIQKIYEKFILEGNRNISDILEECVNLWYKREQYRRMKMIEY